MAEEKKKRANYFELGRRIRQKGEKVVNNWWSVHVK